MVGSRMVYPRIRKSRWATTAAAGLALAFCTTAGVVTTAQAADFPPPPTYALNLPSRITVSAPTVVVRPTLVLTNPQNHSAEPNRVNWTMSNRGGAMTAWCIFDQDPQTHRFALTVPLKATGDGLGPMRVWGYKDTVGDPAAFQDAHTDVRTGSVAYLSTRRAQNTVTLTARAYRYGVKARKFIPYAQIAGTIQYRTPGATGWTTLKTTRQASDGRYTASVRSTVRREYRFVVPAQTYTWGAISSAAAA